MVGGLHGTNRIDNTEIFSAGQSKWTTVGPLPQAIAGLAGATLANTVFMTGMSMSVVEIIDEYSLNLIIASGGCNRSHVSSDIWKFNPIDNTWEVDEQKLSVPTCYHYVSITEYCPTAPTTPSPTTTTTTATTATTETTNTPPRYNLIFKKNVNCEDEGASMLKELSKGTKDKNAPVPLIDTFLNKEKRNDLPRVIKVMRTITKANFPVKDIGKNFTNLFNLLWNSYLPCHNKENIPGFEYLLKKCILHGQEVECSHLFKPMPTDQGICCSFNQKTVLKDSEFSRLLRKKQEASNGGVQSN